MLKRSTMICICIALILIANLPFEKVVITYKYIIYILIPKGNSKFFCSPRHRQLTWCDHQTTCFLSGQKITQRTWCPTTITQLMRKHQSKSRWFSLPRDFLGGPQLVNAGYLCFFLALIYFPIETGSSLKPHWFIQEAMITIALPHCQTSLPDPETNSYCSTASLHLKMNGLEDEIIGDSCLFSGKELLTIWGV